MKWTEDHDLTLCGEVLLQEPFKHPKNSKERGEIWGQIAVNLTALFNNMRTLKFKAQPTNAFFATVNQMFGGSSQFPTTTERAVIKSNRSDNIVGSWEEPPNS